MTLLKKFILKIRTACDEALKQDKASPVDYWYNNPELDILFDRNDPDLKYFGDIYTECRRDFDRATLNAEKDRLISLLRDQIASLEFKVKDLQSRLDQK